MHRGLLRNIERAVVGRSFQNDCLSADTGNAHKAGPVNFIAGKTKHFKS